MKIALCTLVLLRSILPAFQCSYNITRELSSALSHLLYNASTLSSIKTTSYIFNDYTLNINSIYLFDYNISPVPLSTNNEERVELNYSALITASISITNYIERIYTLNTVEFMYSFSLSNIGLSIHNESACALSLKNDFTVKSITQFPDRKSVV